MGNLLYLESFDAPEEQVHHVSESPKSYEEGYAAGLAAAEVTFLESNDQLQQDFVQAITDASFGYHEAQGHLMASVAPLLDAMLSAILPAMLAPALHAHIRDMVMQSLAIDTQAPLSLKVPPDQLSAVQKALADVDTSFLKIIPDSGLAQHGAWLTAQHYETALDLDGTLKAIADHVAALCEVTAQPDKMKAS